MGKLKKFFCLLIAVLLLASIIPSVALADDPAAPSTEAQSNEIYVSKNTGSDPTADKGTKGNPYSTLADAVNAINRSTENNFKIYIMSDLEVNSLARIADKHVTITSCGDQLYTITRGENMSTDSDTARSFYNPAMIEVTTPKGHGASVTLTNITLDDYGRHTCTDDDGPHGTIYAQAVNRENQDPIGSIDNRTFVQDAMVAAYGNAPATAEIILDKGAVLKNYGGMSAVRVTGGALLTMNDGSKICDDTPAVATDRVKEHSTDSTGAAGAVWVQGTEATMKNGSEISNVVGRAIYADDGTVTVDGSISNITGNANMWQGQDGVAVHVRGGANVTLGSNSVIDNDNVTTKISSAAFVTNNSSLEMKQNAKICNLNGTAISGRGNHDGTKDNINIIINGEICGIKQGGGNAINLNESDGLSCIIGENALIHDNTVWAGALYAQGQGIVIDLYGEITDNKSTQNTAGIWLAHNFSGASLRMHPGAEITDNFSIDGESAAVIVSAGTFTMNGGKISNNVTYNKNNSANNLSGGVNVRKNGTFIMNGGEITDNVNHGIGGGISYSDDSANACVILNNGTITGNKMNAEVSIDANGDCSVTGGISNDITVKNNIANNVNRYISISDDVVIGNSKVYMQKYNFSIKRPAEGVKFGNVVTENDFEDKFVPEGEVICETAVTTALSSKKLTQVVGSMWYQTDKGNLPLTVYDLAIEGNQYYNSNKKLYAAVVDTNADGAANQDAAVALYAVDVKEDGSFDLNLPGGATNGTAVVFLQAEDNTTANIITLKPVDLTAYMGGDGGYDQVVIPGAAEQPGSNTLPHPLFQLIGTDGQPMKNVNGTFATSDKTWTLVEDGAGYYHFKEGEGQPPVRVTYTNDKTGKTTLNDNFELKDVHDTFNTYTVALYTGEVDVSKVTARLGTTDYAVALGTGKLTVRAVQNDDPTSLVKTTAPSDPVAADRAAAVVPENTTYTLNGIETVTIPNDGTAAPSLLFDNIIASDGKGDERKAALKAAVDEELGGPDSNRQYEYKYLDLVDANNGNAWIKASNNVTIYWGYPAGTDKHTEFKLVHFQNLHRDTSGGAASGIKPEDITTATTEEIDVTTTDQGITFDVAPGNFSPYVLVWEKTSTSHNPGIIPTPDPDPTPTPEPEEPDQPELERDDHYAYIFGYEDNTIRPENDITRAEVATIFYRLLTDESREAYRTTDHDFTDVSADAWHVEPVATLANAGLLAGYEDGSFRPDAPITRAEYAAIATRFDELAAAESNFTDISGHWAENAINAAYGAGWVGGYEDGSFRPDQNISRAEAMALINRVLERAVDSDGMLDEMTHWADNDPAAWYYADIQEATHSHTYEREEGEQYETWTDLVPHKVF